MRGHAGDWYVVAVAVEGKWRNCNKYWVVVVDNSDRVEWLLAKEVLSVVHDSDNVAIKDRVAKAALTLDNVVQKKQPVKVTGCLCAFMISDC